MSLHGHHRAAPCCSSTARSTDLSASSRVNPLGQGRGSYARFRRARPFAPERLRSYRVPQAFACDRCTPYPCSSIACTAFPVSPATHPSTPSSRRWSSTSQIPRCANVKHLAARDQRDVRPTSANQSFQRGAPAAVRCSTLPRLSPRPRRRHARFTPRLPRKPSRLACAWTLSFHRAAPERDLRRFVRRPAEARAGFRPPVRTVRSRPSVRRPREGNRRFHGPKRLPPMNTPSRSLPRSPGLAAAIRVSPSCRPRGCHHLARAELPVHLRREIESFRKRSSTEAFLRADDVHRRLPHDPAREHARELSIPDALSRDGRRVPKHAPAELSASGNRPEGRFAPPRRRLEHPWSPQVSLESRDSPLARQPAALGLASTIAPRRATTSTRPDAFHRLEPR